MNRELRIYGPPGTGKTSYLKQRVEATVRERGEDSIKIASLTRAAAAEIAGRVELPREAVGTLHAHAFHALGRPELAETPQGIAEWNKRAHKLSEALVLSKRRPTDLDDAAGEALVPSTEGEGLLQSYSTLRAACVPRDEWPRSVVRFAEHWETFKRETKRLDFNDLIEQALEEVPYAPGSPSVFLVDEAQDFSRLDFKLARKWGEACEVFVTVGDPDQALYAWRGADPEAFHASEASEVQVLERSYRVPVAVHEYATRWLEEWLPTRTGAEYHPRLEEDGTEAPGKLRRAPFTYSTPEPLVDELEANLASGRRVMVLAACGFHLEPLLAVLRARGVPFGNPYRVNDGHLNPLAGAGRVRAFLAAQPVEKGGVGGRLWTWDEVRLFCEPLTAKTTLGRGAKALIESKCMPGSLLDDEKPGEREVDLGVLDLFLDDEARSAVWDGDLDWYERNLRSSRAGALTYSLNVARRHGARALHSMPSSDGGAGIVVGTIHSVKGGEAEIVYVFPDLSRTGCAGWLVRGPRHDAVARQFYVAFTRAREELVLCEPSGRFNLQFPAGGEL